MFWLCGFDIFWFVVKWVGLNIEGWDDLNICRILVRVIDFFFFWGEREVVWSFEVCGKVNE